MNRMEEYQEFMKELNRVPAELDGTLERATRRKRKRSAVTRSIVGLAASFAVFVLLVNGSETIAYACSQIPILRELAQAVTFSKSLSKAVENEYVQEMNLTQTDGDVTAEIEYLIVDRKSVYIFYKLHSDVHEVMNARKNVLSADGSEELEVAWVDPNFGLSSGELTYLRLEFEESVPDTMRLELNVFAGEIVEESNSIAHFNFFLEFDPEFTSTGEMIELNQAVEIEGQKIIIESIEIYPTQMCINVTQPAENTAWLESLNFYILIEDDQSFAQGSDGVMAYGRMEDDNYVSYIAESIYFYNANEIKMVITGAKWLDKNQEKAYINLNTGEYSGFPSHIRFESLKRRTDGIELWVEVEQPKDTGLYTILYSYYDADGKEYSFIERGGTAVDSSVEGDKEYSLQYGFIQDYQEDEVWIEFSYSKDWRPKEAIVIQIK